MKRSWISKVAALSLSLLVLAGCGGKAPAAGEAPATGGQGSGAPAKLGTVRLGNLKFAFYQAFWYLPKLAPKYGFEVDTKEFKKALDGMEALKAGAIDVMVGGAEGAITAASNGTDLYIVAGFSEGGLRMVARKEFAGTTLKDLVGHKVALVRGIQELALKAELKQAGLKWSDKGDKDAVQLVIFAATPDMDNALKAGQVDAEIQSEPGGSQSIAQGFAKDFLLPYDTGLGKMPRAVSMSKKFYDNNPKLAEAFLKAFVEATMYLKAHPDEGKKLMMDDVFKGQLAAEAYDQSMGNAALIVDMPQAVLQTHADLMAEFGMIRQPMQVTKILKLEALEKAKKELNYR